MAWGPRAQSSQGARRLRWSCALLSTTTSLKAMSLPSASPYGYCLLGRDSLTIACSAAISGCTSGGPAGEMKEMGRRTSTKDREPREQEQHFHGLASTRGRAAMLSQTQTAKGKLRW